MARFLAMAKLKQAWLCSSGLTKTFHFMARFLAMAKLKQAWLCSSGLTKTFVFLLFTLCLIFVASIEAGEDALVPLKYLFGAEETV